MARRAVLGALGGGKYGLKVSRPGFDALSGATVGKKIAFDSTWTRAMRVLKRGRIVAPPSSDGPPAYVNVNFGETLSTRPIVFVLKLVTGDRWKLAQPVGGEVSFSVAGGQDVIVETNRIRLLRPAGGATYSYIVLRRM